MFCKVTTLEFNSFLERKLWPTFDSEKASAAHLITIALLINEKVGLVASKAVTRLCHAVWAQVRDGSVSAWDSVAARKEKLLAQTSSF